MSALSMKMIETPGSFLHVVPDAHMQELMSEVLERAGRDEPVVRTSAALNIGPLADVDDGMALRIAWWEELVGVFDEDAHAHLGNDCDAWTRILDDDRPVLVIHGPHPGERLLALRTCWQLRHAPHRVFEVALPVVKRKSMPDFFSMAGMRNVDELIRALTTARHVEDVAERAATWERIRSDSGNGTRALVNERLVELPVDAYDGLLLASVAADWTLLRRAMVAVITDNPIGTNIVAARIQHLIATGVLEGEGWDDGLRAPERLRRVTR